MIEPFNQNATFRQSVNAQLLTTELTTLSAALKAILSSQAEAERTFEPMEPYIELRIAPAVGPVIEFDYLCRPEEIQATINEIGLVEKAFPERKVL